MRNRAVVLAFLGAIVLSLALASLAATTTVLTPPEPLVPSVDGANHFPLAFQNVRGSPFNYTSSGACHLCPTDVLQGDLDDCYVLSSLAAIAVVSPGTIEAAIGPVAIDDRANNVFPVTLYAAAGGPPQVRMVESNFPAIASAGGVWNFLNSRPYSSGLYWSNWVRGQAAFFYAQPVANWWNSVKGDAVIWPMLMEKAFSYTKGGYPGLRVGGGKSYEAMQVITGEPGGGYLVEPNLAPSRVTSVYVQDSPALADTGSHSILGGLLRGDLKAIQPSLRICLTPSGRPGTACTSVCPESHSCRGTFNGGSVAVASGQKIRVRVLDSPAGGPEHEIANFDEEPATCTEQAPCKYDVPESQWVLAGPLIISFVVKNAPAVTLTGGVEGLLTTTTEIDSKLRELVSNHWAVTTGTVDTCTGRIPCDEFFGEGKLEHHHDYYFISYDPSRGVITLGNPHASVVAVTLNAFLHAFQQIAYNKVKTRGSSCGCN